MSRYFVCDWCGAEFAEPSEIASVNMWLGCDDIGQDLHMCMRCSPDFLKRKFPDDPKPIEGGGEWGSSA